MANESSDNERLRREQKEFWSGAAQGWQESWSQRQRYVQPASDRLVALAGLEPGQRVLDIATGLGEPAVTAARRVGPSGLVVATDQAPGMISRGRERVAALGLKNVEFIETDAETLAVGDRKFDAVVCRMGLMFVPDLDAAARRIAALLAPGGRFATAVWGRPEKVPMISVPENIVRTVGKLSPRAPDALHPLRLADPTPLCRALERAGFKEIAVEPMTVRMEFPSAQAFAQQRRGAGPLRSLMGQLSPELQEKSIQQIEEAMRNYADAAGVVHMDNEVICISAHL